MAKNIIRFVLWLCMIWVKFARAFQGLKADLSADLVKANPRYALFGTAR